MGSAATIRPAWSITTADAPRSSSGGELPVGWLATDPAGSGCGSDKDDMAPLGLRSWHRVFIKSRLNDWRPRTIWANSSRSGQ